MTAREAASKSVVSVAVRHDKGGMLWVWRHDVGLAVPLQAGVDANYVVRDATDAELAYDDWRPGPFVFETGSESIN